MYITIVIFIISIIIVKYNCKNKQIKYTSEYIQKRNEIAESYIHKYGDSRFHMNKIYTSDKIKLNEDISLLVEIILPENNDIQIEYLWNRIEEELRIKISHLYHIKNNLKKRKQQEIKLKKLKNNH